MPRLILEEFGTPRPRQRPVVEEGLHEDRQLESYEQGYAAGWDDATAAASDDSGKVSAALASALQDISFSYHEAYTHVLTSLHPVLREIIAKLLPKIAQAALPDLVLERLQDLLRDAAGAPVTLTVSPQDRARIEWLLPADPGFPLTVDERDTLTEGQVFLAAATLEDEIDIQETIAAIATAVDEFFMLNERPNANG